MRILSLFALLGVFAGSLAAGEERRPNILFIILDDWGWSDCGAYGSTWVRTPNIDRVAAEGVRFANAFTSNPKCSPCRASILTGRNSWQLEEATNHNGLFPKKYAAYPDLLEQSGYAIGLVGKGWAPGDYQATGWTRNPAGPGFNARTRAKRLTEGISRNDYEANFDDFLAQRPAGKPFAVWLGIFEPHRRYEVGSGVRAGKQIADVRVPPFLPDLEGVRGDLADYALEVESADAVIGRVLRRIDELGETDNTIVAITSDHGMPFPFVKGRIHEDAFRLPLIVRWPKGIARGRVVEDFVNVRDLAPTWLELAGLPPHPQMTGRSLVRQLRATESGWIDGTRDTMLVGKERHDLGRPHDWGYPQRGIRTREFLYVHNWFPDRWPACDPETGFGLYDPGATKDIIRALGGYYYELSFGKRPADELYRLTDDPHCARNLAHDPAFESTRRELRERMLAMLREEQDPRAMGNGAVFDTYEYRGGREKAYDTWVKKQEGRETKRE